MTAVRGREIFVFDLDGTLYPSTVGIERRIIPALRAVLSRRLGMSLKETVDLIHALNRQHGYCIRGLGATGLIDPGSVIEEVYAEVDRSEIARNQELASALSALREHGRIAVLTNCSRGHADDVLDRLGFREHIDNVLGIQDTEYYLKPDNEAYLNAARALDTDPGCFIYFDDSVRNLHAAYQMGSRCVLVSNGMTEPPMFWENFLRIAHFAPDHMQSTFDLPAFLGRVVERGAVNA